MTFSHLNGTPCTVRNVQLRQSATIQYVYVNNSKPTINTYHIAGTKLNEAFNQGSCSNIKPIWESGIDTKSAGEFLFTRKNQNKRSRHDEFKIIISRRRRAKWRSATLTFVLVAVEKNQLTSYQSHFPRQALCLIQLSMSKIVSSFFF